MMGSTSYRVDSGHLKKLMDLYNRILEMNGISTKLKIATNDLTPLAIAEMLEQQCLANVLGAGTQLGQVPATPGVLKASVVNGPFGSRFIGKISAGKGNLPGIHQVWRVFDSNGHAVKDIIALLDEDIPGAVPMMKPFMSGGYLLGAYPDKEALRQQYAAGRDALPGVILDAGGRFVEGYNYPVELTSRAQALRDQVVKEIEAREIAPYQQQLLTYVTPEELAAVGL
jgi:hypothetical protein